MVTWISHDTDSFIVNEGITSIGKKVSRVVHAPLCVQHRASLEIRDKPHQVIKKSPMQKHQGFFSEPGGIRTHDQELKRLLLGQTSRFFPTISL